MKTTIKRACGHTEVVQLYGSWKERERKEKWLAGQVCEACRRGKQAAGVEMIEREYGLKTFTRGSEKQIAWARQIRVEWLREKISGAARYGEEADKVRRALIAAVNTQLDAGWWINNRTNLSSALAPMYEEEMKKDV